MDLGLKGKRALVLGAGGGLGQAVALSLAAEGALVVAAGRTLDKVQQTVDQIKAAGGTAHAMAWDVREIDRMSVLHEQAVQLAGGHIQILFNNGGGPAPSPVQAQPLSVWQEQVNNLILPVIAVTDAVLPAMKQHGWGRILTNASSGVVVPIPNLAMSNTLRGALVGWNKTLANEVAASGVTANMVLPGRVATDRTRFIDQNKATKEGVAVEEIERRSMASIPVGRYGKPQEYGDVVAFLASERASYVTGSMVRIDGGAILSV